MHRTNNEKKDRLRWLEDRLQTLESNPIVNSYKKWKLISEDNKQTISNQWATYYKTCSVCPQAMKYHEMRDALKKDDLPLLRKLRVEARELNARLPRIPKPSSCDPNLFWTDDFCKDYDRIIEEMGTINRTVRLSATDIFNS